jgi:hypothetical protein
MNLKSEHWIHFKRITTLYLGLVSPDVRAASKSAAGTCGCANAMNAHESSGAEKCEPATAGGLAYTSPERTQEQWNNRPANWPERFMKKCPRLCGSG